MTLERNTTYNGLQVCQKCGWPMAGPNEEERHARHCSHVEGGKAAVALAAQFPELRSTKFGYGTDNLTFELDKKMHVRFRCSHKGTFSLEEVYLLENLTEGQAEALVEAIAAWRRGHR